MIETVQKNIEIYGELIKETRTSYYVSDWNGVDRHIPKSKVKAKTKHGVRGNHYAFTIPEVLAIQKGFI